MSGIGAGSLAQEASLTSRPHTILLVDDEPAVRALAARILRNAGHDVIEAASGDEALALAEQHSEVLDLLVTDVLMRGINGRELADRLRARHPQLPILFMSGYSPAQVDLDPTALDAGFIEKPFAPVELQERVRELLDA